MNLPHFDSMHDVPAHLTTRSGLKKLGLGKERPMPVATVTSYGKTVFLYDTQARPTTTMQPQPPVPEQKSSQAAKPRVRIKKG